MLLLITSTKLITTYQSHQLLKDVLQYADQYYCKNSTTLQLLTRWILQLATKIITVPNDISHALCLLVTVKSKLFLPYSLQMMMCCCQKRKQLWWGGGGGEAEEEVSRLFCFQNGSHSQWCNVNDSLQSLNDFGTELLQVYIGLIYNLLKKDVQFKIQL